MNWLIFAVIAIVAWGVWGLLLKIAYNYVDWKQLFILTDVGILISTVVFYLYFRPSFANLSQTGVVLSIITGITGSIGALGFYLALNQGKISIAVPLTSLYPAVTILLALLILKEKITIIQGLGIGLALVSMFLMSM